MLSHVCSGQIPVSSPFGGFPPTVSSSVCMAVHRHSHSPIAKGTRRDVLSGELLSLHQVVLTDIAVGQIDAGIQISVDHMPTYRTHIDPVLQLKIRMDMSAV